MASADHRLGANFRDTLIKLAGIRLSDVAGRSTTDYADIICGDGVPSGGYGRASGASLVYLQKDADAAEVVTWASCDGGTTWARANAISPERFSLKWLAGQRGKPGLNADIQSATEATREIADPDFELLGTNAASSCSAYDTGGGIALTTAGASGDQVILVGHLDASQSAWGTVLWPTSKSLIYEAVIKTGSNITATTIWAGLKLTNTPVVATDDDQVFVRYQDTQNSGKWQVISSIAGTDTTTNTTLTAVATSTVYRVRIVLASDRTAKVYINGTLVYTTAALTSANLIPYIGVQADTAAAKAITVRSQAISRLY